VLIVMLSYFIQGETLKVCKSFAYEFIKLIFNVRNKLAMSQENCAFLGYFSLRSSKLLTDVSG